mmetsp:Transcript_11864/g.14122  ORF Transcript_11864/g.14122 Transcript_11864/m.14122 type:complete len:134 (+) Transcript_11864:829-1230(+)|eukprot:CAMPEP_0197863328 /NCGR_PEP_ID=MMETSP1438-20131217/40699_1 /TAXON_ID=1461541 /ORGANISM="Pterosperma sp., Strain CCMP1384" /LENGTH=133 /DNA_ID=CAMNT_0043481181 /DNA_START=822 /DNA_END=1223 /DNA_ORIENTATION=+
MTAEYWEEEDDTFESQSVLPLTINRRQRKSLSKSRKVLEQLALRLHKKVERMTSDLMSLGLTLFEAKYKGDPEQLQLLSETEEKIKNRSDKIVRADKKLDDIYALLIDLLRDMRELQGDPAEYIARLLDEEEE